MGLLFSADTGTIASYVSCEALLGDAQRALASEPKMIEDSDGRRRRNPWLMVRRDALEGIGRFGSLLALSPVARARVDMTPSEPEQSASELLAG